MCTSLTFSSQNSYFLARTMDFAFELHGYPIFIPENYCLNSDLGNHFKTKYSFIGMGRKLTEYTLVDGLNNQGLGIAALYFAGEAVYADHKKGNNMVNLGPHELVNWILGNISSCSDLKEQLSRINIVQVPNSLLNIVVPLHWIISDKYGECYVLESRNDGIHLIENKVGVMTNSPEFEWHVKNLSNYVNTQPGPHSEKKYNNYISHPFGPGSGAIGLPGDYTSSSRFVRTTFMREYSNKDISDLDALNTLIHIMNTVDITKGVKLKEDGEIDYTQYRSYMNLSALTYYVQKYEGQDIFTLSLDDSISKSREPIEYNLPNQTTFYSLNK